MNISVVCKLKIKISDILISASNIRFYWFHMFLKCRFSQGQNINIFVRLNVNIFNNLLDFQTNG